MAEEFTPQELAPAAARGTLNRRQLVKASVWAAPAIALVAASPAFAGSRGTISVQSIASTVANSGNTRTHSVTVVLYNSGPLAATGVSVTFTASTGPGTVTGGSHVVSVGAGGTTTITGITWTTAPGNGQTVTVTFPTDTPSWTYNDVTTPGFNGNTPIRYPAV